MRAKLVAKVFKISDEHNIQDVFFPDDPSEKDILSAMQSSGELHYVGGVRDYEVWNGSDVENYVVIGGSPSLGSVSKKRKSCDLSDDDVEKIILGILKISDDIS